MPAWRPQVALLALRGLHALSVRSVPDDRSDRRAVERVKRQVCRTEARGKSTTARCFGMRLACLCPESWYPMRTPHAIAVGLLAGLTMGVLACAQDEPAKTAS